MRWQRRAVLGQVLLALALVGACGPTSQPAAPSKSGAASEPATQASKPRGSITVAVAWEPDQLTAKGTGGEAGPDTRWMFNSPLTSSDPQGGILPMLAERVPTQENGDWVVNPDGTMLTTYRIRSNVRWHDGTPLSAQDFSFAFQAYMDPALTFRSEVERRMTSVVAREEHTVD